jgi:S1-C subfamily serine protease
MRKLVVLSIAVALGATACSLGSGGNDAQSASALAQSSAPASPASQATGESPVVAVVKKVLPAVVNVTSDITQDGQQGKGVGTGFVVDPDGVIVTNCHVVENATKITVFTSDADPKKYDARVIGGDCLHDLAVLKVGATGLATVPLGNSSSLQLGQSVVALGYALALEGGPTVTSGIVSSLNRTIQVQDPGCTSCKDGTRTYTDVVQTDAAINHGNSGGPLVNLSGQVVGINSAGDDQAQNIGFAIAIDSAKDTIANAEAHPLAPSAFLGVSTVTVTPPLAAQAGLKVQQGVYVAATTSGGPAEAAGIKQGDVIVAVNGTEVTSSDDLGSILDGLAPGQTASVEVVRSNGTHDTASVTLGSRPLPAELP